MTSSESDNLIIDKQIGKGAYACVKLAYSKKLNKKVALKIYEKDKLKDSKRKERIEREINILKKLNNPYIVKLYDSTETNKEIILIMKYIDGMDLCEYIKTKPEKKLNESEARIIFKQIVDGIMYCHNNGIVHRDIKLANILIDRFNNVKIIDFGFSTYFINGKNIKLFCGTPAYMAPEIILQKEYSGPPVDIWALGVLLYIILYGKFPYGSSNNEDMYDKIIENNFKCSSDISNCAITLLKRLLQVDPSKRPNGYQILSDDWLQNSAQYNTNTRSLNEKYSILNHNKNHRRTCTGVTTKVKHTNLDEIENNVYESLNQLGYTKVEINQGIKDTNSHIYILYKKIKSHKIRNEITIPRVRCKIKVKDLENI